MKIYHIAKQKDEEREEQYKVFEKMIYDNLYGWDRLPYSIRNNKGMWDEFAKKKP